MASRQYLPTLEAEYARTVAVHFASSLGIDPDSVYSRSRIGLTCLARQLAYLHLNRAVGWSLEDVAAAFARDHSTIGNQVKLAERKVRFDTDLQELMAMAPRPGERVFTEPALVTLYARLTRLVGEAVTVRDEIDAALRSYVPSRNHRDNHVGKSRLAQAPLDTVVA